MGLFFSFPHVKNPQGLGSILSIVFFHHSLNGITIDQYALTKSRVKMGDN